MSSEIGMGKLLIRKHGAQPGFALSGMRGFTLIELMIVVLAIAILAAIAYPNYTEQVRKAHRNQAKADLVEYAQMAERHYTVNNSYTDFVLPTEQSPREAGATVRYNLALESAATTFTVTASATGSQTSDSCGDLSLSSTGQKTAGGDLADCW